MNYLLSIILVFTFLGNAYSQIEYKRIKANQLGYFPEAEKIAIVPETKAEKFVVKDATSGKIVFKGKLSEAKKYEFSDEIVKQANFTKLEKPGRYFIECTDKKIENSYQFTIGEAVYSDLARTAINGFYLARVSTPILDEFAGIYQRPAGHPDTDVIIHKSAADSIRPEGSVISSPGGWYDAGDYNKYIVNSGITTFTLLHIYELFPEYFQNLKLSIPENTNHVPDLLDEILWNLRWMLTMQDTKDGGVYHKLTNLGFDGFIMPHEATKPRYVVSKSTAAALNLAAVSAKASRIFSAFEDELPGFADSCLSASKAAWQWALNNPEVYYIQPEDVITGAYDDFNVSDEFAWASIELFLSTEDDSYLIDDLTSKLNYDVTVWKFTSSMGLYSLFNQSSIKIKDQEKIEQTFIQNAERLYNIYETSAYKTSIDSFKWGSNSYHSNQAIYFLMAYEISGSEKYLRSAQAAVHYILGNNPTGYSFVTGYGTKYPEDLHDRRSGGDTIPGSIPGYLAGGPTNQVQSDCGQDAYESSIPAFSYIDKKCSYSTNEIAINWQAAFVFVINYFEATKE
jgi:endoglucanase